MPPEEFLGLDKVSTPRQRRIRLGVCDILHNDLRTLTPDQVTKLRS